ncbi:MAG: tRNA uridine-5-carboxymethylaminomethyl(34) synthesis GTPase MnmE [Bacteroidota bacterium]
MNYQQHNLADTIVAIATPPGIGAIGVIRLSGKDAISIVDAVFYGKTLTEQASHTIHFGTIRNEENEILDEVLVSLFVAPKSYTGEHVVEVSCHGSNYIHKEVMQLFIRKGARLAQPGEFTLRAFLNGRMDLSQAEAVADLIAAESAGAHDLALKQMRGGFSSEIQNLRQELIDFASLLELELDFSQEDVEFADRIELVTLVKKIRVIIMGLIRSFQLGNVIKHGVNTVIAGRPNAGKSTLLNALLNEERAIVSDIAGTTRDTIEEVLNIDGIAFRLIDTAGLREAGDQIEAIGIQKTLEKIEQSAILVYVYDVMTMELEAVKADIEKLYKPEIKTLILGNKMDELYSLHDNPLHYKEQAYMAKGGDKILQDLKANLGIEYHFISAKRADDIAKVKSALSSLVGYEAQDQTVVSTARHYEALSKADGSLSAVLAGLESEIPSDLVAMDIRHALRYLGEILGEVTSEDLLSNIFGRFCIGK